MNVFLAVMLAFACIGILDKIFDFKWGMAESFDKGMAMMGSMAMPVIGVSCVGVEFIQRNADAITEMTDWMPFDPSFIIGCVLALDMGGYFISAQLTENMDMLLLNGVVLSSIIGPLLSFQLPMFMSAIEKKDHFTILKGFIIGLIVIPAGLIIGASVLRTDFSQFMIEFIALTIFCLILAGCILRFPAQIIRVFSVFARFVQIMIGIMFLITLAGVFIPSVAYSEIDAFYNAMAILFRCAVVICGSLVLSRVILRFFKNGIKKIGDRMGVNEVSVIGLMLSFSTSLAIFPIFSQMDEKGKMLNAAFGVSGAFTLGGQFGFASSVCEFSGLLAFLLSKLTCGILSVFVMCKLYERMSAKTI